MNDETSQKKFPFKKLEGRKIWYSTDRVCSPAGRLMFESLREPSNTPFELKVEEGQTPKPPRYSMTLLWENKEALLGQEIYQDYRKMTRAFVDAAIPKHADKVDYPITTLFKEDTDEEYWRLQARAKATRPPKFYIAKEDRLATDEEKDKILRNGCVAAVEGPMQISFVNGRFFLRIQLEIAYHIADGDPEAAIRPVKAPPMSAFGNFSNTDSTEQAREEVDGDI